ncbi:co-chaperone GroES [Candidatus Synchoanobacter obligatus]|uniref:Co-chaperonin GroES n=1 Tax=Candidatus Synchoanobacter obligatus TaxID=2919597 RepID=A0ABT1L5X0_9GAMM|nr:co-chaperone GroES [Candidatus Synchoanobacter obligatus]
MMTVKIKPLADRVVVKAHPAEEKTQGGIYIPVKTEEKVVEAEVVAVGPGKVADGKSISLVLKVGQTVVFNQYSATEVESEGEKFLVLREDDVVAVIE